MAEPATHRHAVRVYYEDTDAGGIVYHANYLKFAERARTELLTAAGFEHRQLMAEHGAGFAVRKAEIDFLKPALLDDRLAVETRITRLSGASVDMRQTLRREADSQVVADIAIKLAMIDGRGRPVRVPKPVAEAMRAYSAR